MPGGVAANKMAHHRKNKISEEKATQSIAGIFVHRRNKAIAAL